MLMLQVRLALFLFLVRRSYRSYRSTWSLRRSPFVFTRRVVGRSMRLRIVRLALIRCRWSLVLPVGLTPWNRVTLLRLYSTRRFTYVLCRMTALITVLVALDIRVLRRVLIRMIRRRLTYRSVPGMCPRFIFVNKPVSLFP